MKTKQKNAKFFFKLSMATAIFLGLTANAKDAKMLDNELDVYSTKFSMKKFLRSLSLEEKINFLGGGGFTIRGNKRLGIPEVLMADGPMGVKKVKDPTALIANIGLAASWNRELSALYGNILGNEAYHGNVAIVLAPGVNIYRLPQNGRNFEYLGEDPFLVSELVVPYIQNIQKYDVMATVKHYIANNQDFNRHRGNSVVSERALREIYMPAFKASVQKGKVAALMTAYGAINGVHAAENNYLINDVLRKEWGFEGIVMSDWNSVYNTVNSLKFGIDLEMPTGKYFNQKAIKKALNENLITEEMINKKIATIVSTCRRFNTYILMTKPKQDFDRKQHALDAKKIADESIVLLKNDNFLPLEKNPAIKKKVVFVGPNAKYTPKSGGGAANVPTKLGNDYYMSFKKMANNEKYDVSFVNLFPKKDKRYQPITDYNNPLYQQIKNADIVIACVGFSGAQGQLREGEGGDRKFTMPIKQQEILTKITELNDNTVVVIIAGGGVKMNPWLQKSKAVLHSWYQGQVGGSSVGDIIFGNVNPSAKLPISIEKEWKDSAAYKFYNEDKNAIGFTGWSLGGRHHQLEDDYYGEDIFVGYRHFDKNKIDPQFEFGYGLSYTTFKYSNVKLSCNKINRNSKITISVDVTNTGKYTGKEIIQLYINEVKPTVARPPKELKGFEKIALKPNETKTVTFTITKDSLKYYDGLYRRWIVNNGEFKILIGASSRDIKFTKTFSYKN
ncbi:glycoside hydrolase family 3 C-terminal domain-containing protein [Lentisphaerota bacterium WC36G]|nr:glycoside hydrolase family 3 C-terminal domain-containing protein [Lentisphaerae bacterium WC36]